MDDIPFCGTMVRIPIPPRPMGVTLPAVQVIGAGLLLPAVQPGAGLGARAAFR